MSAHGSTDGDRQIKMIQMLTFAKGDLKLYKRPNAWRQVIANT